MTFDHFSAPDLINAVNCSGEAERREDVRAGDREIGRAGDGDP